MWLLVGLGNPGKKYAKNRHNIGFMVADELCDDFKKKFNGLYGEAHLGSEKVGILKPQTYMNESGQSVGAAAKFYKIKPERIVVFHDELDLKPGEVRVKQGGGNAGHNGLKSIQAHLGTADFWRVRIGIGHPGDRDRVSDYVLSDFAKAEQEWVEGVLEALSEHYSVLARSGIKEYESKVQSHLKN